MKTNTAALLESMQRKLQASIRREAAELLRERVDLCAIASFLVYSKRAERKMLRAREDLLNGQPFRNE